MVDRYEITRCEQTRLQVCLMEGSISQNRAGHTMIRPPEAYVGLNDHDQYEGFAHQLLDVAGKLKEAREEWRAAGHPLSKQDLDSNEKSQTIWL